MAQAPPIALAFMSLQSSLRLIHSIQMLFAHRQRVAAGEIESRETPDMRSELRDATERAAKECDAFIEVVRSVGPRPRDDAAHRDMLSKVAIAATHHLPMLAAWITDATLINNRVKMKEVSVSMHAMQVLAVLVEDEYRLLLAAMAIESIKGD